MQATGAVAATTSVANVAAAEKNGDEASKASPRVRNLLGQLSLKEKVGQMTQVAVSSLDPNDVGELFTKHKVGSLLSGGAAPPTYDPAELRRQLDDLQRWVVDRTDHGIPFLYGLDAVHGNATVDGATVFPHNLGVGATRNVDLAAELGRHTGKSLASVGAHWNFAPDADLQRDPRWGRFYEGFSEDPLLTAEMVASAVAEMQAGDDTEVTATVKHFAGYSEPENGNDRSPAHLPIRKLRRLFFPPFEAGLRAGSGAVMVNSGSVNGIPVHASEYLLTDVLRDQWGFEGVVLSDWDDFERMVTMHEYVPTFRDAVREGVNAGVDVYMEPENAERFVTTLVDLVHEGEVPRKRIDEAARRVLQLKERLGMFDDPFAAPDPTDVVGTASDLARRAATESMTLLQNDGALPLANIDSLLVTGPSADSLRNQMGGWTLGWQGYPDDVDALPQGTTVLEGIENAVGDETDIAHVPTGFEWEPYGDDTFTFTNREEVVSAAEQADAVVAVLGEGPYSEGFGDTVTLELPNAEQLLPGPQQRLVDALASVDAPTVGVIVAGRPRGGEWTMERLDAALMAYQPGTAAGPAVADVLFGETDPAGRLPFSWPTSTGQLINVYDHLPPKHGDEPLFEFGHGLSYTDFEYSELTLRPKGAPADPDAVVEVGVTVHNVGDRRGSDAVHAYLSQAYGSVGYPDEQLLGFERVHLGPDERQRVVIEAPLSTLMVIPGDIPADTERKVLEPGKYAVSVGDLTATFNIGSGGYDEWEGETKNEGGTD